MKKKIQTKKSDVVKAGTENTSANNGALSNLLNKLRPSSTAPMSKLIPIKCIEDDKFKMQDDSYMDIVQIVTKDLNSASESDLEALIAAWARMYRTNGFDMKLVSLNTPTDTRGQQHYIQKKIAQNKVPIYDYILREMETQLENVQETRTDRQYYILLFAESQDDYFYALSRISQTLIYNDLARKMSLPAKLAVLEKLNNKSQTIQVQNATKVNITYPEKMTDAQIRQKIEKLGYDPWLLEAIQPKGGLRPVNERYVETGCGYEACITVSKFPARVEEFWLTRLMNMDNIVCVIDINTEDPNISKKNINAGMREQERRAEDASDTTVKKTAAQRYAELNALWDDIDVMGEVLKLVKVRIFVEGRTYDECDKRVKSVLDRLDAAGYEASIFLNEEINDFRSVYLPYTKQQELEEAKVYARYGQPLESITLADGIPFHFTNLVDPTGTYLGSTSLGGTVLFDMHTQNNVRTAYNGVVLGKQGAGKSTLLKKLLESMAVRGHYIRGFDPVGEYRHIVELLGGAYIALDGTRGILNALEILKTSDEGEGMCYVNHSAKMRTVYLLLNPNASVQEANAFEDYLQEFYVEYGLIDPNKSLDEQTITGLAADKYPIFSDFVAYLEKRRAAIRAGSNKIEADLAIREARTCDNIYKAFRSLVTNYGAIFNGHTSIDNIMDRQIVFFNIANLKSMKPEVFDAQLFLALTLCWDNCVKVGAYMKEQYETHAIEKDDITRFEIFIDEAHEIINTDKIAAVEQITVFAREARKYFGGILCATHSIRDFVPEGASTEGINKLKTFFELCEYKFILNQDTNALPVLQQVFANKLTVGDLEAIPRFGKGEMVFCVSSDRNIQMHVEITQFEEENFKGGA